MIKNILGLMIMAVIIWSCHESKKTPKTPNITIDMSGFADGIHHWDLFATNTNYPRIDADDYVAIANNIVKFQNTDGGWSKNLDWLALVDIDSLKKTLSKRYQQSTFDNENTHPQIEFLSRMFQITGNEKYKNSARKGFEYILATQNESGGWRGWDVDAITFNDKVTTGIVSKLIDVKQKAPHYNWIEKPLRDALLVSLNKALQTIIKCQIEVEGVKKGWCQQHDHVTFEPVKARSFELPSIASRESVTILRTLMKIEIPDSSIVDAVDSAVRWLKVSEIENLRIDTIPISPDTYKGQNLDIDRVAVVDSTAKAIWARFYEISDNRPFFCRRDGKKVFTLAEVNPERRGGYEWYGFWPEILIAHEYPEWKKRISK